MDPAEQQVPETPEPEAEEAPESQRVDQPTMAYEIPAAGEPEPGDEQLAMTAEEFETQFGDEDPPPADEFTFEHDAVPADASNGDVEFSAVHLGGVATLPSAEEIALRLSEEGLDLLQADGHIVGRLGWGDIEALEVTVPHGRRRRRGSPRLVIHTAGGSARFEVPGLSGEELQSQVQPLMARYGH